MAVRVTRRMASRALRILGSGTSSTRTLVVPLQQTARMGHTSGSEGVLGVDHRTLAVRLAFGGGHFARFHEVLEAPQVFLDLALQGVVAEARHRLAQQVAG